MKPQSSRDDMQVPGKVERVVCEEEGKFAAGRWLSYDGILIT